MPELLGQHELIAVPSYRLITVRDQDNDAGVGLDEAITQAQTIVAASTGYELVICCVQDLLPVSARLEAWSAQPTEVGAPDWSTPQVFELECPSALLVLSSPTGEALDADLPTGPGIYALESPTRGENRRLLCAKKSSSTATSSAANKPSSRHRRAASNGTGFECGLWPHCPPTKTNRRRASSTSLSVQKNALDLSEARVRTEQLITVPPVNATPATIVIDA